jgi:hypothetical protein
MLLFDAAATPGCAAVTFHPGNCTSGSVCRIVDDQARRRHRAVRACGTRIHALQHIDDIQRQSGLKLQRSSNACLLKQHQQPDCRQVLQLSCQWRKHPASGPAPAARNSMVTSPLNDLSVCAANALLTSSYVILPAS